MLQNGTLEEMVARAGELLQDVESAQITYEKQLDRIAELHSCTFESDGAWYQIRKRLESKQGRPITYLCKLKKPPADRAARSVTPVETLGGTVVID